MTTLRKILVYLLALALSVFAFIGYNHFFGTPKITPQDSRGAPDIDVPEFGKDSSGIGNVKIGTVKPSRFVDLDENKNIKQIFGYDELLNPDEGTDQWKLNKPYMNIFEGNSRYKITSDRGTVRVEDVAGKPSPTDAHLKDDVVIQILSNPSDAGPTETNIYLDDLIYNSERSEFSSDGPVKIVSDQGTMQGTGLLLVYNGNLGRIEYLEITRLHEIYIYDVSKLSSSKEEPAKPKQPSQKTTALASKHDTRTAAKPKPATALQPATEPEKTSPPVENFYTCTITENVIIKYGNRITIVGSDEIVINNVQFADNSAKAPDETTPDASIASDPVTSVVSAPAAPVTPSAPVAPASKETKPAPDKDVIDLTVTCNGSLIIIPVENENTASKKLDRPHKITRHDKTNLFCADPPANSNFALATESANLAQTQSTPSAPAPVIDKDQQPTPPAQFSADRIDYDMITGDAIARGNIRFTFYTDPSTDADPLADPVPMVITAEKNAEFFADRDRIIFNKNVVGTRKIDIPAYVQTNTFRGQKLIVDLVPKDTVDETTVTVNPDTTDIRHITVIGGTVKLESLRKSADVTLSNTILTCRRIDYEDSSAIITATGPGELFVNNENAPPAPDDPNGTDKGMSFKGPCYAYMQGFDKLNWFTAANRITAYGKADSLFVSHMTLKDGLLTKRVRVATSHVQADLIETDAGRNELVSLNATGGITYNETELQVDEEKSRPDNIAYIENEANEFIGDNLFYDVPASLITVNGSPRFPCFFNGVRVDKIEYDPQTEKVKADMSSSPSPMTPSKKKRK